MANGFRHVQDMMNQLTRTTDASAACGVVKDKYIVLEVEDPDVPILDLIDLPGMVHVDDESKPGKRAAIRDLYDAQIARDASAGGEGCIYLAVVPNPSEQNAPICNPTLQFIKEHTLESRTIGVFTNA